MFENKNCDYQVGYRLAKSPESYIVLDILRITEGGLAPVSCLEFSLKPKYFEYVQLPIYRGNTVLCEPGNYFLF